MYRIMFDTIDFTDRFGAWSTDGCTKVAANGDSIGCECTQLAHFGILFVSNYRLHNDPRSMHMIYRI